MVHCSGDHNRSREANQRYGSWTNTLLEEAVSVEIRIRPEDSLKFGMTAYQASSLIRSVLT
ncbi:hypothetical protein [Ferviditalea candida]|uniref:Transposase n=1 Tax=Ferviditalea candida TaxID=3108399 RepID=A0ABU5ZFY2_9BACL|nr:hypothetical protein [Paenibacillaceae bacterium T2]